jgi:hypothetical protein
MLLLNAVMLVLSCGDLQLNEEMSSPLLLEKTQEKTLE